MILLSIILPWLSFFARGKVFSGLLCLILQITLIGWLPAAIWSVVSLNNERNEKRIKEMEHRIISAQNKN